MKPVVIQGNVYFAAENDAELAKMLGAITSRKKKGSSERECSYCHRIVGSKGIGIHRKKCLTRLQRLENYKNNNG